MKLSPNFDLSEFTRSKAAEEHGVDNSPNDQQIKNLILWCMNIGEPVRKHFGKPVVITSGFRSAALNAVIGGANSSQHSKGEAADFHIPGVPNVDIFRYIMGDLAFDQLIAEKLSETNGDAGWIHTSYVAGTGNRHDVLSYVADKGGKKIYTKGLHFVA